jgi:hypothetical protein
VHICGPADPALDRVAVVTGERPYPARPRR